MFVEVGLCVGIHFYDVAEDIWIDFAVNFTELEYFRNIKNISFVDFFSNFVKGRQFFVFKAETNDSVVDE